MKRNIHKVHAEAYTAPEVRYADLGGCTIAFKAYRTNERRRVEVEYDIVLKMNWWFFRHLVRALWDALTKRHEATQRELSQDLNLKSELLRQPPF